jgi:8-oxo-dGTP diphosphatase
VFLDKKQMVQFKQKHIGCEEALNLPPPQCVQKPVVLVAAAALIDGDGRVLMAQRPAGKTMAGLWEFPGGKVHDGETPEFALMRELEEELGIQTRPCCFSAIAFASHGYDDFHLLMPLFACRVWKGIPQPKEGQSLKWLRPNEMFALPMPDADMPLAAQLQALL